MKFSNTVRRREVAFMIRLLTIFGVVEQRQMRLLFDHMSNRSYGQILARLRQEGLAYFHSAKLTWVWPISRRMANSSQQVDTH